MGRMNNWGGLGCFFWGVSGKTSESSYTTDMLSDFVDQLWSIHSLIQNAPKCNPCTCTCHHSWEERTGWVCLSSLDITYMWPMFMTITIVLFTLLFNISLDGSCDNSLSTLQHRHIFSWQSSRQIHVSMTDDLNYWWPASSVQAWGQIHFLTGQARKVNLKWNWMLHSLWHNDISRLHCDQRYWYAFHDVSLL